MKQYMVSVVAPKEDDEGNLDGDVIVVDAKNEDDANEQVRNKLAADAERSDWKIHDTTVYVEVDPEDLLPADYEVQR